jgi:hypothetical protein
MPVDGPISDLDRAKWALAPVTVAPVTPAWAHSVRLSRQDKTDAAPDQGAPRCSSVQPRHDQGRRQCIAMARAALRAAPPITAARMITVVRLNLERSVRRSTKGGPGESVAAPSATGRRDRRRSRGRTMYATAPAKSPKRTTTATSTRVSHLDSPRECRDFIGFCGPSRVVFPHHTHLAHGRTDSIG